MKMVFCTMCPYISESKEFEPIAAFFFKCQFGMLACLHIFSLILG